MIARQYSETVAVAEVPAHKEQTCVTYCDLESKTRCKTGVTIGPGLCPSSYRDSVIVYVDSTRRRYVSRVEYTTRMKALSYSDTSYTRPRAPARSFAAFVDHCPETHRKWYKSSVRLEPRMYSSTQAYSLPDHRKSEFADRKTSLGALTDGDASMESLDYLSDGTGSSPEAPSPLRISTGNGLPLDNATTIKTRSYLRETHENGDTTSGRDTNANVMLRSGPFIYKASKYGAGGHRTSGMDADEEWHNGEVNGINHYPTTNGHHLNRHHSATNGHPRHHYSTSNGINGFDPRHLPDDLVDL